MKKLILILVFAFACFAFADSTSINEEYVVADRGMCDDFGGPTIVNVSLDCDGDGIHDISDSAITCNDFADAWFEVYFSFC